MTSDDLPQDDLFPMELETSTSLPAGSRAKTSRLPDNRKASQKKQDLDSGTNSFELLGRFDHDTPCLRTSQRSFLETTGDGCDRFSGTFPKSGTMQNGNVYQHHKLALRTLGTGSGFFPTPRSSEYKDSGPVGSKSHKHMLDRSYLCATVKDPTKPLGMLNPQFVEWMMGYPMEYTKDEQQLELKIEPPD